MKCQNQNRPSSFPGRMSSEASKPRFSLLWSPYVIGQTIIFLPCDFYLSFFLFFIPCLISAVGDLMSTIPYFHAWCGLCANLECRSETCCTRHAENTRRKKVAKNRHLGTIAQLSGDIFTTKARVDNRKKTC